MLWGHEKALKRQDRERAFLVGRDAYIEGDMIVGEFLGDTDKLLVRCDPQCDDFGSVSVTLPIDRRPDWPHLWQSLSDFIEVFVERGGKKYWPH